MNAEEGKKTGPLGKIVGSLPPGRYDSHIHVRVEEPDPETLKKAFDAAGLAGGCILSISPEDWKFSGKQPPSPEKAMDDVIAWASGSPTIYPFYWIDPLRPDACDLVDMAVEKGIYGFKVIRNDAPPCDMQTMPVYRKIASANRPITFHSGILWDACSSSEYMRPANWEPLVTVPRLRFALAHVSWPWCDECIAVYGKLLNAMLRRGTEVPEMFIDITPGTPKNYRSRVLHDLYETGYDLLDHVQFGTDCYTDAYNVDWMKDWMTRDDGIYAELGLGEREVDGIYRKSFERYLFGGGGERTAPTFDGLAKKIG